MKTLLILFCLCVQFLSSAQITDTYNFTFLPTEEDSVLILIQENDSLFYSFYHQTTDTFSIELGEATAFIQFCNLTTGKRKIFSKEGYSAIGKHVKGQVDMSNGKSMTCYWVNGEIYSRVISEEETLRILSMCN